MVILRLDRRIHELFPHTCNTFIHFSDLAINPVIKSQGQDD